MSLAFPLVTLLCLYLINLFILHVGPNHYREVVENAVTKGNFVSELPMPLAYHSPRYAHEVNDCLSLAILVYPRHDPPLIQPISPMVPDRTTSIISQADLVAKGYPPPGHCSDLYRFLQNPQDVPYSGYYHRYLHGSTAYIGFLLAFLSIRAARLLSVLMSYGFIAFLAIASFLNIRKHRRSGQPFARDLAFFVLALDLILIGGIYPYAWSLTLAPSYCVVFAFLILSYFRPLATIGEREFVVIALAFGCLTIFFELNTGEIAIGLMALLVALALGEATDARLLLRRALLGAGCFCLAVVLCLALKMVVVAAVWGSRELTVFQSNLAIRFGHENLAANLTPKEVRLFSMTHVDPYLLERSRTLASAYTFFKTLYASWGLFYGSLVLAVVVIVTSWTGSIIVNWRAMRSNLPAPERMAFGLLLAAAMVTPAWYLAFPNATILHSSYFSRPLAWIPALFMVGIICRRSWLLPGLLAMESPKAKSRRANAESAESPLVKTSVS